MQPRKIDLTIWNCHQLRRLGAVDFKAMVHFGGLTVRAKNSILFALNNGFTRSGQHYGSGLLAYKLLQMSGQFHLITSTRRRTTRWGGSPYWISWLATRDPVTRICHPPAWFVERMAPIVEADNTAAALQNFKHFNASTLEPNSGYHRFWVLKLTDHLPSVMADHVASDEYKAAVAPLIRLVEEGGQMEVDIPAPAGQYWRT